MPHRSRRFALAALAFLALALGAGLHISWPGGAGPARALAARRSFFAPPAVLPHDEPPLTLAQVAPSAMQQDRVAVTFTSDATQAAAAPAIAALGVRLRPGVPALHVAQALLPAGMDVASALPLLARVPGVTAAEPLPRPRSAFLPDDPLFISGQPYLELMHAEEAWDIQRGNRGIVVAVLDSGVDITHPDLQGQIWTNPQPGSTGCPGDVHGCNFVDPGEVDPSCSNQSDALPPNGDIRPFHFHGTFVAGVLGAATNNGVGVAGVVPNATIMPVRIGDCTGPLNMPLANGVMYAVQNGAQIINLSLGLPGCGPLPSFVLDAIDYAVQSGVIVVAATGNDGIPCVASPANHPGVIAVGASQGDARATFSQWGPEVSVVAPGVNIMSTVPQRSLAPPMDYYSVEYGTSFSTPMVAGLADLLLSQNPLLSPAQVRALIQGGAKPINDGGQPGSVGAGRIDLLHSLQLVPAAIYGRVTNGGAPAAAGLPVEASIGGQDCGDATTYSGAGATWYVVFVAPAAETAGCGVAGASVTLLISGQPIATTAWQQTMVPLDLNFGAAPPASSLTPPDALLAPPAADVRRARV